MSIGIVVRSTGSRYIVRSEDGVLHDCVAKGNLRVKGWNSTNPLAVGDRVDFIPQANAEAVGSILEMHHRKNYVVRRGEPGSGADHRHARATAHFLRLHRSLSSHCRGLSGTSDRGGEQDR
jgi:RsgA N-terminal domain